ncbi:MAG: transglycosylase SLT domain-containing protein [Nanoarchaeota archaeon]|nr:transglycosylase SLT domain-containing protein [Nanoarchaeota archaeon]MBU4124307.1 transglycosylase SLT domain-containing protein [Nanoarchaeota archaeon]
MKKLMTLVFILLLSTTGFADFKQPVATQGEPIGDWWTQIVSTCYNKWNVDPYFAASIIKRESWFDEEVEPGGLFQLNGIIAGIPIPNMIGWEDSMPNTAIYNKMPIVTDLLDGMENIDRGCWYLSSLLKYYNNDYNITALAYDEGWQYVSVQTNYKNNEYVKVVSNYQNEYLESITDKPKNNPTGSMTGLVIAETNKKAVNFEPYYLVGGIGVIILSLILVIILGKKK